jgi:hypothetical protein
MACIKNPWGDGRDAATLDGKCAGRPCLNVGENKGFFTIGKGYTSYYKNPPLVCMERHLHGCPSPPPPMDPERVRCCRVPDFPKSRGNPRKQRCRTCGQWAKGVVLTLRRDLPAQENVPCKHSRVRRGEKDELFAPWGTWRCPDCMLYWTHKPQPREPGESFGQLLDRRYPHPPKES